MFFFWSRVPLCHVSIVRTISQILEFFRRAALHVNRSAKLLPHERTTSHLFPVTIFLTKNIHKSLLFHLMGKKNPLSSPPFFPQPGPFKNPQQLSGLSFCTRPNGRQRGALYVRVGWGEDGLLPPPHHPSDKDIFMIRRCDEAN